MGSTSNCILLLSFLFIGQFHFGYNKKYSPSSNKLACIETERRALLEFKRSLVDNANRLASWTSTREDCCSWDGITCNPRTGHVEKLDLHNPIQPYLSLYKSNLPSYFNNCLGGEVNPSILNLEYLNYLDLSFNGFGRIQIPTFLGSLKNLRYLNLIGAEFGGEIPPHLGNLSNLQYLYLSTINMFSSNYLTAKSLRWITGFSSLKALELSSVNLTESVDWLSYINMLPSLSSLSLRGCGLAATLYSPISLVNLTSIVSLDLGDNNLTDNSGMLLQWLSLSTQLSVLRLDYNLLQGPIPITSEKVTTLTVLDLSFNSFVSSSIPHSLCNHTRLVRLDLSFNGLQGSLPLCLGNLTSLRELHLSNNIFSGKIPSELGYLKQLTDLGLSSNHLKSSIPSSFGKLRKLEFLYLGLNQLYGTVPLTLGKLTNLKLLDISENSLMGELSESHFAKLNSLKYLFIHDNYFLSFTMSLQWVPPFQLQSIFLDSIILGSQFPPWLQIQRSVEKLSMKNASIGNVFPMWFSNFCSSVKSLSLSNNNIHGPLTSFSPDIQELDLSNNFLTGSILLFDAKYVTNNMPLQALKLNNNNLSGNIPDDLCNFSSLLVLSLANNQLIGRIPLCFGNLQQLVVLDLANNSLSGHIPSTLGNLWGLAVLHLNRNKFYGRLPSSLKNLRGLLTLDLGENELMDAIPEWIGKQASNLQLLRLQSNNFYGNISVSFCQLSSVQVLNLAQNNLVGYIPHCLGNLSMMMSNGSGWPTSIETYNNALWNIIKGSEREYSSNLRYVKSISFSGNNLHGEIPDELMNLDGLQNLNLSNNSLSGKIPEKIGNLKQLESLDLSLNQFSGLIPQGLANIDALEYLNLSFNNLSGRIPTGRQFQTLINDPSVYEGNSGLCGVSLAKRCPNDSPMKGNGTAFKQSVNDDEFEFLWFYAGIAPGFAVGMLAVLCLLHFNPPWWQAYFKFVENFYDKVWG